MKKPSGKAYFMISAVAQKYNIHPQTLRLYEREGLLKPSRTEGNTRLYSEEDLEQLETILSLTRDLGVNLAGVEIILNMRRKIEQMQGEVNEFMEYVKREMARGIDDWEQRLSTALVKSSPTDLVDKYPEFFWNCVSQHIDEGIKYLSLTVAGRQWIANLHHHILCAERGRRLLGPQL